MEVIAFLGIFLFLVIIVTRVLIAGLHKDLQVANSIIESLKKENEELRNSNRVTAWTAAWVDKKHKPISFSSYVTIRDGKERVEYSNGSNGKILYLYNSFEEWEKNGGQLDWVAFTSEKELIRAILFQMEKKRKGTHQELINTNLEIGKLEDRLADSEGK